MKCFDIAIRKLVLSKTEEFQQKTTEPPTAEDILKPEEVIPDDVKVPEAEPTKGRKKKFDTDEIRGLKEQGYSVANIARRLGCSEATVYEAIKLPKE